MAFAYDWYITDLSFILSVYRQYNLFSLIVVNIIAIGSYFLHFVA